MIGLMQRLFSFTQETTGNSVVLTATKAKPKATLKAPKSLGLMRRAKIDSTKKLDGWLTYMHDVSAKTSGVAGMTEYEPGKFALTSAVMLCNQVAAYMYKRIHRRADLTRLLALEDAATTNHDPIAQFAYNVYLYEAELKSGPDTEKLEALRAIKEEVKNVPQAPARPEREVAVAPLVEIAYFRDHAAS